MIVTVIQSVLATCNVSNDLATNLFLDVLDKGTLAQTIVILLHLHQTLSPSLHQTPYQRLQSIQCRRQVYRHCRCLQVNVLMIYLGILLMYGVNVDIVHGLEEIQLRVVIVLVSTVDQQHMLVLWYAACVLYQQIHLQL